jgi:hypothetical protein
MWIVAYTLRVWRSRWHFVTDSGGLAVTVSFCAGVDSVLAIGLREFYIPSLHFHPPIFRDALT